MMLQLTAGVAIFCAGLSPLLRAQTSLENSVLPLSFERNVLHGENSALFLARTGVTDILLTPDGAVFRPHSPSRATPVSMQLSGARNAALVTAEDELPGMVNYLVGNNPSQWRIGLPTYSRVRYQAVYKGIDLLYYGSNRLLEYDFIVAPHANPESIRMRFQGLTNLRVAVNGDLVAATPEGSFTLQRPRIYQEVLGSQKMIAGGFAISGGTVGFHIGNYDRSKPLVIDPVLIFSTFLGGSVADAANAIAVDSGGNVYVAGSTQSPDFPVVSALQSQAASPVLGLAFVSKLNPAGTALIYSTYLGGTGGDSAFGLAVDASGAAYVAGSTGSKDFPVTSGAYQNTYPGSKTSFVAKLNPAGNSLTYSTYLGGPSTISYLCCDSAAGVAVDAAGNAYVAGTTYTAAFPVTSGAFQTKKSNNLTGVAYVAKLNPAGSSLLYATFLGGSGQGQFTIGPAVFAGDVGAAIAVDSAGNAYVAGLAHSPDFPVTAGALQSANKAATKQGTSSPIPGFNAFVSKLNSAGSALIYSTYLGGSGITVANGSIGGSTTYLGDAANALAIDGAGNAYVAGLAYSPDFPTTAGAFQTKLSASQIIAQPLNFAAINHNAFVSKLNPAGSGLLYSTFIGGSGSDEVKGLAIDAAGNAYLAGDTSSLDFPVSAGSLQPANKADSANVPLLGNTATTAFFTELNSTGNALAYSTYFGGTGAVTSAIRYVGDIAQAIAVDSASNAYIAGTTYSADFPTTVGADQNTNLAFAAKGQNAFIAKFNPKGSAAGDPPSIRPNFGIGDAASFGPILTPGSLATVFGYSLAGASAQASNLPLTTNLSGTQVLLGGIPAPLLYVSPAQINFQVPWELAGQSQTTLVVKTASGVSAATTVTLNSVAPAVFAANGSGNGAVAAVTVDGKLISPATPAQRGQYVMLYATGLGAVRNQPATGSATSDASSPTLAALTVTIGGVPAMVSFAGLAPGYVGVYQLNVLVPDTVTPGANAPLILTVNGASAKQMTLAVQ